MFVYMYDRWSDHNVYVSQEEGIDVEYWDNLLKRVHIFKARVCLVFLFYLSTILNVFSQAQLTEFHNRLLRINLDNLKRRHSAQAEAVRSSTIAAAESDATDILSIANPPDELSGSIEDIEKELALLAQNASAAPVADAANRASRPRCQHDRAHGLAVLAPDASAALHALLAFVAPDLPDACDRAQHGANRLGTDGWDCQQPGHARYQYCRVPE